MRYYLDVVWFALVGLFLFMAGVTFQWYVHDNPIYPFTLFGNVLETSKEHVADTLEQVGLKTPYYYHQTDFSQSDIWREEHAFAPGLTLITAVRDNRSLEGIPAETSS